MSNFVKLNTYFLYKEEEIEQFEKAAKNLGFEHDEADNYHIKPSMLNLDCVESYWKYTHWDENDSLRILTKSGDRVQIMYDDEAKKYFNI